MKSTKTDHPWGSPQYMILNGRVRRKGIEFPRRERVLVRRALERAHYRYKEIIPVWNPFATGFHDDQEGAIQWFDFAVLMPSKRMGIILFDPHYGASGTHEWELRQFANKQRLLRYKRIPYIVLKRTSTSQEYEICIRRWKGNLRKEVQYEP